MKRNRGPRGLTLEAWVSNMLAHLNRALGLMISASAATCCLALFSGAQQSPPHVVALPVSNDPVVMTVAEKRITASELCNAIQRLPPPQRNGYPLHPELVEQWYGPLVALAEEARREHLDGGFDGQGLSEVDRDNALAGELIRAISRQAEPSEPDIEAFYRKHKGEFEEVRVRHILISHQAALASRSSRSLSEARAKSKEIATQLESGADFGTLAGQESEDPDTRSKGGDLGYVRHHQLEPEVDKVLWSLAAGQTSAPFEGRFGYEILHVEERRTIPLENVREPIIGRIKADVLENREREIIAAAHITMDKAYVNSGLPCQPPARPFTLPDRLDLR